MSGLLNYAKERRTTLRSEIERLDNFIKLGEQLEVEKDKAKTTSSPMPLKPVNGLGSSDQAQAARNG